MRSVGAEGTWRSLVRVVFEEHEDHLLNSDCIPVETEKRYLGGVQMMIQYFKEIDILNIELHEGEFGYSEELDCGPLGNCGTHHVPPASVSHSMQQKMRKQGVWIARFMYRCFRNYQR